MENKDIYKNPSSELKSQREKSSPRPHSIFLQKYKLCSYYARVSSLYFIPLRPYSRQRLTCAQTQIMCVLLKLGVQISHPYGTKGEIIGNNMVCDILDYDAG